LTPTKADKVRRDHLRELLNRGCVCHLNPPCNLCSGLDKDELDIFVNDGTDALLNLFDSLDEELESVDRPMAAAAEQAAAALAAAEQRGADRERAAIVAYLRERGLLDQADRIGRGEHPRVGSAARSMAAEEVYALLSEGLEIVEDLSSYHEVWAQKVRVVLGCDQ